MSMKVRREVIGEATLYCGDCRDILPALDRIDAVVTDPPYGIGASKAKAHSRIRDRKAWPTVAWDDKPAPPEAIAAILELSVPTVIWGGNYFALPPARCWAVWDKMNPPGFSMADAELGWTNLDRAVRKWTGRAPRQGLDEKCHPTQKPLALMEWCIGLARAPVGSVVLDPFMGSGTTGIACANLARSFVGIELDPGYFDTACRRIEAAQKQNVKLAA